MKSRHISRSIIVTSLLLAYILAPHSARADEPFIGEIKWVAFNYAPVGWAFCNGQTLNISQNPALYSLIGATFGGDGKTTFAVPDMRGRAPIHVSLPTYYLGSKGGEESHTLSIGETPYHSHALKGDPREANSIYPAGNYPAKGSGGTPAYGGSSSGAMAATAVAVSGSGLSHDNMKPYQTLNCIIATAGIYPVRP